MHVHADRIRIDGPHGTLLPPTSFGVGSGELAVVQGPPGPGLTGFGLALAGRMRLTAGAVTLRDGEPPADGEQAGAAELRERVAIVDAPGVSEPEGSLPLRAVVGEELALARLPASRDDAATWLADNGLADDADTRFEDLRAEARTFVLTTLAAARPRVGMLVLDTPDRHTWDIAPWFELATRHAELGFAVVVLAATAHPTTLPVPAARFGQREQPPPLTPAGPAVHTEHTDQHDTDHGEDERSCAP
ncbi:ABC transporter ATP-binding protein [Haloechinothrix sp. LS1_15]|uniref:ABC transporter ATP-binding protein n=1 Tax=Haloechinothrix sp. LS1_15 TaxID=2652248 RepID=UPI00294B183E|nr:ABC transporter ATP-binding protein [Haloechinothrix sp. LS1_15]